MQLVRLVGIATVIAACSSTETADEDGDSDSSASSGAGGSGAGSGAGASSASSSASGEGGGPASSGSTTGTGGVGGSQICADLCAHATALGCPTAPDCEGDCEAGFANAGDCADELEAFLTCVAYESTTCEDFEVAPRACERPAQALVECTGM